MTLLCTTEVFEGMPPFAKLSLAIRHDFHIDGENVFKLAPDATPPDDEDNIIQFPIGNEI